MRFWLDLLLARRGLHRVAFSNIFFRERGIPKIDTPDDLRGSSVAVTPPRSGTPPPPGFSFCKGVARNSFVIFVPFVADAPSCLLCQVFVFGPDNLIWELDKASATAENVLGRARGSGIRMIDGGGTLVNGKAVPSHYTFKNGDVVDIDLAMA